MTSGELYKARPEPSNYAPDDEAYVSKVPDANVLEVLRDQIEEMSEIFGRMTDEDASFRYAEGKWSLQQLVGHCTDTERVDVYRAMRIARADDTPLAGYDENHYVVESNFDTRSLADLLSEFVLVRKATIAFFGTLDAGAWSKTGVANDFTYSVRAIAFIIAGHLEHHRRVIGERYLPLMGRFGQR